MGGQGLTDPSDAAIYLVRFGDKAVLVDAGSGRDHNQLRKNIAQCLEPNVQLEYLLLTHCHFDHTGGAQAVRDEYGCRIVAHELDAIYLQSGDDFVTGATVYGARLEPFAIDIKLQHQESTLSVGNGRVTAIHCPGHSPGSVVYTVDIDGQLVLFAQDLHGPIRSEWLSDEKQYLAGLEKVANLKPDLLLESHFGIFETESVIADFIDECKNPRPEACKC